MLTNQPDSLGKVVAFQERPYNFTIQMPDGYVIDEPVTVEIWTYESMVDDTTPVTVDGQNILFTFEIEQLREFAETRFFVVFDGDKKLGANVIVTMDPAYPSESSIQVVMSDGSGIVNVSVWSDRENALLAQQAAAAAEAAVTVAEAAADAAAASAVEAASAAAGAQTTFYQWGTWNADTNTPTLPSNPSSLVVSGKYPQVTVTVPGEVDIPVEGYTIGQVLPVGFLYGQPPKTGFPSGYWSFISADSAANLQFQKNHVKFQIGPPTNFDIDQNNTDVTVNLTGFITVFDEFFGFRVVNPPASPITVANNQVLVLSSLSGSYASPGLDTKGTGQELFLRTVTFNTLTNPLDGLAEIGSVQQFVWNPRFPSLQTRAVEKNNAKFDIGPTDFIQIVEDTLTTTINITGVITVRDALSGYRGVGIQSIVLNNNETVVLSASNSSYVDPQLYVKGTGQNLFLWKYTLSALNRPPKGAAVLGCVSQFKWTTAISSMQDKTPVNALKTRASDLESFQVRRSEVYIGPKNNIKIATQDGGTTYKVEILAALSIRDERSGFWVVPVQSIGMTNNQVLCLALNAYPAAYVDPGFNTTKGTGGTVNLYKYNLNELSNKFAGTIVLGMLVNGIWIGQHPSFTGDYIDRITDLVQKGLAPRISTDRSQYIDKMPELTEWLHLKDKDFTFYVTNGSIYDNIYCTKRPNPEFRTPRSNDFGVVSQIEDEIMKAVPMQKFRGIAAKVELGSPADVFTESGMTTATTKFYDTDWDLVFTSPPAQTSQGLETRVLEGGTPVLSFSFRNGEESLHFVNRVAGLNSGHVGIAIEGGNGYVQVLHEVWDTTSSTGTWQEANGYDWQQHKNTGTVHPAWGAATGLKESIAQHRLKFRRNPANPDRLNRVITMTATDGGRICYHGISYSSVKHQLIFINDCKGSHGINELKAYDAWRLDYYKPNFIFFGANTINMLPVYTSSYNPDSFATDFVNFVNYLKGKSYTRSQVGTGGYVDGPYNPEVVMGIDFCSRTQQLLDVTDKTPTNVFTTYGPATLVDFIYKMAYRVEKDCNIAVSNAFPVHQEMIARYKTFTGDTMYRAAHQYTGATSMSQTTDTTHLNDKGAYTSAAVHLQMFNLLR